MKVSAALPTGVEALFFESARRRRRLEEGMVAHLEASGYGEVILPVVDYLEPYEELENAESRRELYRFIDRDGEVLALRSDFTPMLARLLAPRLPSLELPLRLFYRGDVLRYQEARAGRERELYQLGAEIVARDGAAAEREALVRFLETLAAGERHRVLVVLGFAGALDRPLLEHQGDAGPPELVAAVVRRERRAAASGGAVLRQVVERGVPDDPADLGKAAAERLVALLELARELDAAYPQVELRVDLAEFADQTADPRLEAAAGKRAYYDGLVFRAFAGAAAEPIGGGGRYDRLWKRLGVEVAAAGFSVSLDRLVGREDASENRGRGEVER